VAEGPPQRRGRKVAAMESARYTASEVCRLAGYSKVTLRRRISAGRLPKPVDRGREMLFDRQAVDRALGLAPEKEQDGGWTSV